MLKRSRILCLILLPTFVFPSTITPVHNKAMQIAEKRVDNNEMVEIQDIRLKNFMEQYEKTKIENEKKKAEEETKKEKELEEQKKNEPQWQEFILTFYTSLESENSSAGAVTCQNKPLSRGGVANNVIPQNTKLYLEKWGEVIVNDKGSNKHFSVDTRLDVYIEREQGESDRQYRARVSSYGKQKVRGYIVK